MTKPYKEILTKTKCWLGLHEWTLVEAGPMYGNLMHLHVWADSLHQCNHCGKQRNYLHDRGIK